MKGGKLHRWIHLQHGLLIVLIAWLYVTSPWVHLYNRIPPSPSFWVWSHLVLGMIALVLTVTFTVTCLAQGRLRQFFPWAFGRFRLLFSDLAGLVRLRIPSNEAGGLFDVIKGLLLLALLVTAVTGGMWWWTEGSRDAIAWRGWHLDAARYLMIFLILHILATIAHLIDFMRQ